MSRPTGRCSGRAPCQQALTHESGRHRLGLHCPKGAWRRGLTECQHRCSQCSERASAPRYPPCGSPATSQPSERELSHDLRPGGRAVRSASPSSDRGAPVLQIVPQGAMSGLKFYKLGLSMSCKHGAALNLVWKHG